MCKTDDVNKYGYDRVLYPLLQGMKTLELDYYLADLLKVRFMLLRRIIWGLTVLQVLMRAFLVGISVDFAQEQKQKSKQKRTNQVHSWTKVVLSPKRLPTSAFRQAILQILCMIWHSSSGACTVFGIAYIQEVFHTSDPQQIHPALPLQVGRQDK